MSNGMQSRHGDSQQLATNAVELFRKKKRQQIINSRYSGEVGGVRKLGHDAGQNFAVYTFEVTWEGKFEKFLL